MNSKLKLATSLLMAGGLFMACEDTETAGKISDQEQVGPEVDNSLVLDQLSGVSIETGTKILEHPVPNGALDLSLTNNTASALLETGFSINMTTQSPVTGAYIILKDDSGTSDDSYFDVTLNGGNDFFAKDNKEGVRKHSGFQRSSSAKQFEDELRIDVSFDDTVPVILLRDLCV